jgi:hypothetical protein
LLYLPIKQKQKAMETSIKVGYDSQTGFYTFKNGFNTTMELNGKSTSDPLRGFRSGELVVTSEKPETITYKTSGRKLIGYDNIEDLTTISVEKYKEVEAKINLTREWDEDSEEFTYSNLEDEIFAFKFARTYKPIYENVEEIHNLEIEFINYPVSAYKCIIPLYSLDANNVFETKCKFVPNNSELFFEVCASYGIDKSRIDLPTHSGLRYVKIDDKFVTGMEDFEKTSSPTIIATYDECVARMNSIRKRLEDIISFQIAKESQKLLDKGTVGELLKELLALKNRVLGLDVKQKDYSSLRALTTKITELIETYAQLA